MQSPTNTTKKTITYELMHMDNVVATVSTLGQTKIFNEQFLPYDIYLEESNDFDATAEKVFAEKGKKINYLVGTMIELPRAALMAEEIAESASFFGFGTNDLTQTTLGMSRDDTGAILDEYRAKGASVAASFLQSK